MALVSVLVSTLEFAIGKVLALELLAVTMPGLLGPGG